MGIFLVRIKIKTFVQRAEIHEANFIRNRGLNRCEKIAKNALNYPMPILMLNALTSNDFSFAESMSL